MNFEWSETQKAFQTSVRAFAERVIEPEAREYDEKSLFPRETFREMGREGYLGITVPAHYG
ncbi:MAG: acyl-CoA dehydrogenase, partial [Deltaproteobacteria bacterium]|nr:acyl-CoA dehydrogenase [Deltaproteobacteria bacterium]